MGVDVIRDNSNKENKGRGCGGPKMSGWDNSSELRDEVLVNRNGGKVVLARKVKKIIRVRSEYF